MTAAAPPDPPWAVIIATTTGLITFLIWFARWSWMRLKGLVDFLALPRRVISLQAKIDKVERKAAEDVNALRQEMVALIHAQNQTVRTEIQTVAAEVRSIADNMATKADHKRAEKKIDDLLQQLALANLQRH